MKVLLVEGNVADARLVRTLLADSGATGVELVHVLRLTDALKRIQHERFDAVLLDPGPPDARGLEGMRRVQEYMDDLPVVLFSGHHSDTPSADPATAREDDVAIRARGNGALLMQAIQRAIERENSDRQIQYLAHHDGLTGLPNRRLLLDRLRHAIARARRDHRIVAVLFIDVDGFKAINDTLGHAAGDQVLQSMAARAAAQVRESDTLARYGGDEFTIVLSQLARLEDASRFASKLQHALEQPMQAGEVELRLSVSIGISLFPNDGDSSEQLLSCADAAMYEAKRRDDPEGHFCFSGEVEREAAERRSLGADLLRAIDADEFELHYQPRVEASSQEIVGVEALLRWRHPTRGLLGPAEFLPLLGDLGLSARLASWVLSRACERARDWNRIREQRPVVISVNLSARELASRELAETVERTLRSTRLAPEHLELELPETHVMRDDESSTGTLRELHGLGVRLSIDDFGVGYSSPRRLKALPIHALKIDRSLVRDIAADRADAAIVTGIITMARGMGVRNVAQGVETGEQRAVLLAQGCDELQGYYFGRPRPAEELAGLLSAP